jgi:drug/metabolite transporter (DMT)-like permease
VTGVRLAAGLVGQLVWIGFDARQRVALQAFVPSPAWRTLIPASFLGSYVAMFLWLGGFKWASVSVASVLNQLASVFTLILARIVLKEHVSGRKALGAAVAVAGATWVLLTG